MSDVAAKKFDFRLSSWVFAVAAACVFWTGCQAQTESFSSPEVSEIAAEIAKKNEYNSSAIGYDGIMPQQWKNFQALIKVATEKDLSLLTKHSSPAVRCYAFKALVEQKSKLTFPVLTEHLTDYQLVETLVGCLGGEMKVGDFYLEQFEYRGHLDTSVYQLSRLEEELLDSIFIFQPEIELYKKADYLEKIECKPDFYRQILKNCKESKQASFFVCLASYQNAADTSILLRWLKSLPKNEWAEGLKAISKFPDPAFFRFVEKAHGKVIADNEMAYPYLLKYLYRSLLCYEISKTRNLLELSLAISDQWTLKKHSENLWLQLAKSQSSYFEDFKQKINLTTEEKEYFERWYDDF